MYQSMRILSVGCNYIYTAQDQQCQLTEHRQMERTDVLAVGTSAVGILVDLPMGLQVG